MVYAWHGIRIWNGLSIQLAIINASSHFSTQLGYQNHRRGIRAFAFFKKWYPVLEMNQALLSNSSFLIGFIRHRRIATERLFPVLTGCSTNVVASLLSLKTVLCFSSSVSVWSLWDAVNCCPSFSQRWQLLTIMGFSAISWSWLGFIKLYFLQGSSEKFPLTFSSI